MKTLKRRIGFTLTVISLLAAIAPAQSAAPASVVVLPDTFGTVTIGDIPGLLDKAGDLANKVMPGFDKKMVRQQFGAMLGDPELEGLPGGSGIAVVIPRSGLPFAFLEVSEQKIESYQELLKQRGLPAADQVDGLLVAATNNASLEAAKRFAGNVQSRILEGSGEPSISASVKLADVLRQYEPQAKAALANMTERMQEMTTGTANMDGAKAAMKMYYSLGKKVDLLQLTFSPTADGLTMNYLVKPVGGVTKTTPPPAEVAGPAMMKLIPGKDGIRGDWTFDPAWMAGPMMKTFADVMQEGGVSAEKSAQLQEWMKSIADVFAGGMATSLGIHEENPMAGAYAISVKDEVKAIQFLKEMPDKMDSTGLTEFYKTIGMPMTVTFKENTGEHNGTAIHQLTMNFDLSQYPEEQRKQMEKMLGDGTYEIAVANKVLLYSMKPVKMEELIDAAKAGSHPQTAPLESRSNLPEGGTFYVDYNLGAIMKFAGMTAGERQKANFKSMEENLSNAPSVQIAGYSDDEFLRLTIQIPSETMKAFAPGMGAPNSPAGEEPENQ